MRLQKKCSVLWGKKIAIHCMYAFVWGCVVKKADKKDLINIFD